MIFIVNEIGPEHYVWPQAAHLRGKYVISSTLFDQRPNKIVDLDNKWENWHFYPLTCGAHGGWLIENWMKLMFGIKPVENVKTKWHKRPFTLSIFYVYNLGLYT